MQYNTFQDQYLRICNFLQWVLKYAIIYDIILNNWGNIMGLQYLEEELKKLLEINDKFGKWEDELSEYIKRGKLFSIKLFEMLTKTPIDWNTFWIVNSIASFTLDNNVDNFEDDLNQAVKKRKILIRLLPNMWLKVCSPPLCKIVLVPFGYFGGAGGFCFSFFQKIFQLQQTFCLILCFGCLHPALSGGSEPEPPDSTALRSTQRSAGFRPLWGPHPAPQPDRPTAASGPPFCTPPAR